MNMAYSVNMYKGNPCDFPKIAKTQIVNLAPGEQCLLQIDLDPGKVGVTESEKSTRT